jgi:2-dehydro-3-deoxyphosphogluconate aldolase/(4S)-4-hydroxy-2-oxoglutarate aldolase
MKNAPDYLRLPNVLCVGGSWAADPSLLKEGRWDEVRRLATEASKLER